MKTKVVGGGEKLKISKKNKRDTSSKVEESSNKKKKNDSNVALHKINFKHYQTQGIQSMCFNQNKTILAIGRFNGDIQFWNLKTDQWFPFKV